MPEVRHMEKAEVVFLYTEIGRGHPGYLDGIVESLERSYPDVNYLVADVFSLSRGMSLAAWKLVRKLYYWGAQGGIITRLYGFLRKASGSGEGSRRSGILGRDLKISLSRYKGPVVVAHPILAGILSGQNMVIYQHGELAAPAESMVRGCHALLVPLERTADVFIEAGIDREKLVITGQCIELDLIFQVETAFKQRMERLEGASPLGVAMFSSGAYPREHLHKLRLAAFSLYNAGHNIFLFTGRSEAVTAEFVRYFERRGVAPGTDLDGLSRLKIIRSADRADENRKMAAIFQKLDIFVAPAHERTNWAIGLGFPFFILGPHIGSYAPLNAAIAIGADVAYGIDNNRKAAGLGEIIGRMRHENRLVKLARNGMGRTDVTGFERCARWIADFGGKA